MLFPKSHYTFGEIADLWATEIAGDPPAENREEILARIAIGLKRHEFDHADLMIWRAATSVRSAGWRPVSYEMLENTLFYVPDKHHRKVWLEGLRISKDDFGRWCDEHEITRPRFWFDGKEGNATVADRKEEPTTAPSTATQSASPPKRRGRPSLREEIRTAYEKIPFEPSQQAGSR